MTYRRAAAVIAGLLLVVGLVLLFTPVRADDVSGPVACGSVVAPDNSGPDADWPDAEVAIFARLHGECLSALSSRRTAALVIGGIGGLGLLFVALTSRRVAVHPPAYDEHAEQQQ